MAIVAASEIAREQTESAPEEGADMWCKDSGSGRVGSGEQVLERPTKAGDSPVPESPEGLCRDSRLGCLGIGGRMWQWSSANSKYDTRSDSELVA